MISTCYFKHVLGTDKVINQLFVALKIIKYFGCKSLFHQTFNNNSITRQPAFNRLQNCLYFVLTDLKNNNNIIKNH